MAAGGRPYLNAFDDLVAHHPGADSGIMQKIWSRSKVICI